MNNPKTALITGGSRGIGRAICLELARHSWDICFTFNNNHEAAEKTKSEIQEMGRIAHSIQANIADTAERAHLVSECRNVFSDLSLLVNNAGMAPKVRKDLLEISEESWDEVLDVNLKGAFFLTQQIGKWMLESQSREKEIRTIININSISAYTSSPNRGQYCISKAGMGMMTSLFADRLADDQIHVFEIRPGIIKTDMTAGVSGKYDALIENGLTPIKRWGQPQDVAKAAAAIAENLFPFSTGEVINVDGGFHLRRL